MGDEWAIIQGLSYIYNVGGHSGSTFILTEIFNIRNSGMQPNSVNIGLRSGQAVILNKSFSYSLPESKQFG